MLATTFAGLPVLLYVYLLTGCYHKRRCSKARVAGLLQSATQFSLDPGAQHAARSSIMPYLVFSLLFRVALLVEILGAQQLVVYIAGVGMSLAYMLAYPGILYLTLVMDSQYWRQWALLAQNTVPSGSKDGSRPVSRLRTSSALSISSDMFRPLLADEASPRAATAGSGTPVAAARRRSSTGNEPSSFGSASAGVGTAGDAAAVAGLAPIVRTVPKEDEASVLINPGGENSAGGVSLTEHGTFGKHAASAKTVDFAFLQIGEFIGRCGHVGCVLCQ